MRWRVGEYINRYKKSLFIVDKEELSRGSKVLLFIFVLAIFMIIGWGLSWQQDQTKSPYKEFGYKCVNLLKREKPLDFAYFNSYYSSNYKSIKRDFGEGSECRELGRYYIAFVKSRLYTTNISRLKKLESKKYELSSKIKRLKDSYSDMLLEQIALQEPNSSILPSSASRVSTDLADKERGLSSIIAKIKEIKTLSNYPKYIEFDRYYQRQKSHIFKEYKSQTRLYHFKRTIQAFAFLFPVWLLFYLIYRFLVKRRYFILSHLTIHVANVSAIYGLFYLITFIYSVVPKIFLGKFIAFFMQYNLTIFLNILIIIIFIVIFGFIIYSLQKSNSTGIKKRKSQRKNLRDGRCSECGCLITDSHCPLCGFSHYEPCKSCGEDRLRRGDFCQRCGANIGLMQK
jgi:hypothetical protein